ncbi:hypothetical protein CHS0354_018285 [Potamilus streckersoni]|uniref:Uncharacterized protein n=1 Tax=Potamilus streckersoni TaxID=2493646 RepID=A0AAE0WDS4_9BIVA|nr:hypothetical protein CHS0354_018285 [Potamilus streckersoni]
MELINETYPYLKENKEAHLSSPTTVSNTHRKQRGQENYFGGKRGMEAMEVTLSKGKSENKWKENAGTEDKMGKKYQQSRTRRNDKDYQLLSSTPPTAATIAVLATNAANSAQNKSLQYKETKEPASTR